jgi:hypothetical protein
MRAYQLKFLVIVLSALSSGSLCAGTVWKWVDKGGITHYSDQPVPGAVQVDLLSPQTYDADQATIPAANRTAKTSSEAAASSYAGIAITAPTNEETLAGTGGQVSISVQVEPGLQAGDSLRITMDGQTVSQPDSTATTLLLNDVARGAHTLTASVVGPDGRPLIQSSTITFFMQQQSALRKR